MKRVTCRRLRLAFNRFRSFAIYAAGAAALNAISGRMLVLYFSILGAATDAGLFAMANLLLMTPATVVSQAISQVLLSHGAASMKSGALAKTASTLTSYLLVASLPLAVIAAFIVPDAFAILLGREWAGSGEFARWMIPWLLVVMLGSPLSAIPAMYDKNHYDLAFQLTLFSVRVGVLSATWLYGRADLAVPLFSLVSALVWAAFIVLLWSLLSISARDLLRSMMFAVFAAAFAAVPMLLVELLSPYDSQAILRLACGAVMACVTMLILSLPAVRYRILQTSREGPKKILTSARAFDADRDDVPEP